MSSAVIRQLRVVGLVEGASFVALLGIAMPLKYLAGMPRAVSVMGMIHGLLFVIYMAAVVHAQITVRWPLWRSFALLVAAVLPLGTLVVDSRLRRDQLEAAEREAGARALA